MAHTFAARDWYEQRRGGLGEDFVKERGFCPSCTGRRMCSTAANLIEHVLPRVALRQWVLTFPFRWRRRLAQDGELLGHLSRLFASTSAHTIASKSRVFSAPLGLVRATGGSCAAASSHSARRGRSRMDRVTAPFGCHH